MPSVGHVVDLPKSKLGVDIEHNFAPDFVTIKGKEKVLSEIKSAAKGKDNVYLASDPDREGEAIAWHISEHLGKTKSKVSRVLLHEITSAAVKEAVANPSKLDHNLFDAYQARRVLDRLVGYKLSPLLWDKVKRGISAGRVQSVALRIIVDREREREAFRAEEYWTLDARLSGKNPPPFKARLYSYKDDRIDNKAYKLPEAQAREIIAAVEKTPFTVKSVERKEVRRSPAPPFITSRLQQEASRKLYYQPRRTMQIAQKLYEGVELGEEGAVGLITYMRTDSPRVSDQALESVRNHIGSRYGKEYVPDQPNAYKSGKQSQGAHEAIRPTAVERDPESIARYPRQGHARALHADLQSLRLEPDDAGGVRPHDCRHRICRRDFPRDRPGDEVRRLHARIYRGPGRSPADDEEGTLPLLTEGETLTLLGLDPEQHFTQPPPRYTQATLIKELEEQGIGRPSTYAAIMTSILRVEYVEEDESKRMRPTSLGRVVNDMLVKAFPDILEVQLHRAVRRGPRQGRGGHRELGQDDEAVLRPVREGPRRREEENARGQAQGSAYRAQVRARRRRHGDQMGPQRRVPRLLELPQMHQHRRDRARRSGQHHDQAAVSAGAQRRSLREVRQADGQAPLALRRIPGMLRLPRLRRNQAPAIRPGEDRSRVPGMQGRRNPRASQPPRKDFLRMRPLSEM